MLDPTRIRAICFDIDGTLADTDDTYVARFANLMRFLPPARRQRWARRLVMHLETPGQLIFGLPDRLGLDPILFSITEWLHQRFSAKTLKTYTLVPGAYDCVIACAPRYPLAAITTRFEPVAKAILDHAELTPHFRAVAHALTTKRTKPYPDLVMWAAQQMGVPPENCLMVGDTTVDMRAGKTASAQTVGVLCGFGEEDELRYNPPMQRIYRARTDRHWQDARALLHAYAEMLPTLTMADGVCP